MAARDPATARQWVDSASLSADEKQALQAALQKPASK
jgi:hypothetical protein